MWIFNKTLGSESCRVGHVLNKIKTANYKRQTTNASGFSLIESLIATAIVGIGFVGIYSLIVLSEQFTKWAIARQKLQITANQILEVIEGDIANIDSYDMPSALMTCVDPGAATDTYLTRSFEWCTRMSDELGDAGATDTRTISITTVGSKKTVLIVLEAYSGQAQIVMERSYGI